MSQLKRCQSFSLTFGGLHQVRQRRTEDSVAQVNSTLDSLAGPSKRKHDGSSQGPTFREKRVVISNTLPLTSIASFIPTCSFPGFLVCRDPT
eukprot:m.784561 g.784561  ORF g.784561 m.784561 type:complete len:92 (-) comp59156_c0_seq39:281-556(-)